jgi:glycine cleavage system regulatory protein
VITAKPRLRAKNQDRVSVLIQAQDRADVLLPVVAWFDELKIEIEALWMIRAKRTRNERISVTVKTDRDGGRKIVEYLLKVAGVLSVKTQTGDKVLIPSSPHDPE